jgi:uncharacterized protein
MKEKEEKLKILAAADIHGDVGIAKKLAEKAKKNKVDLVVLLGDLHGMQGGEDVITPFKKANQRVVFVPGNWDSSFEANTLRDLHKVKNLDGYYATYKGVGIVGIGNPDFQLELDEKTTFDKLKKNFDKMKPRKRILISHLHAAGTKAEFSGFPGSKGIKKAIDYFQPDFFMSGHIHEAEGLEEKIGKTKVLNVGDKGEIILI